MGEGGKKTRVHVGKRTKKPVGEAAGKKTGRVGGSQKPPGPSAPFQRDGVKEGAGKLAKGKTNKNKQ